MLRELGASTAARALLGAAVLLTTFFADPGGMQPAEAAGVPSPDFSIGIDRSGDGVPECSTRTSPPVDSCRVGVGELFTARVEIHSLTGVLDADGDTIAGYSVLDGRVRWSVPGLEVVSRPGASEVVGSACAARGEAPWDGPGPQDTIRLVCFVVFGEESTALGPAFEVDLVCPSIGQAQVVLPHGLGATHVHDTAGTMVTDLNDKGVDEVLTLDCAFVWDVNEDGIVSVGDIGSVVTAFGDSEPLLDMNTDVNSDGTVSVSDIGHVVAHFGEIALLP